MNNFDKSNTFKELTLNECFKTNAGAVTTTTPIIIQPLEPVKQIVDVINYFNDKIGSN